VVATQLNANEGNTPATHWYTTITVVHSIHSGAQHIYDTETFKLPERQVAPIMISVLILSTSSRHFNILYSARGGGKGREETLC